MVSQPKKGTISRKSIHIEFFFIMSAFSYLLKFVFRGTLSLSLLAIALADLSKPANAQSITVSPDGTGTIVNLDGSTYNITGGTQTGANLFHSFGELGLNSDEIANFLSNPSITNILGRVTGGNPSVIEGLIRVSGGDSNLFLMNPAGWILTKGARLDVPRSFGVTTADRMGFAGGFFNATGENDYAALTGSPTSLMFGRQTPSTILNAADLEVPHGNLWMVGGSVISTGSIETPNGTITLASIPGENKVKLSHEGMLLSLVLDAVPVEEGEVSTSLNLEVTGLKVTDIPRYLTGGGDITSSTGIAYDADGNPQLVGSNVQIRDGETVIGNVLAAEDIVLMGSEVKVADTSLVQGDNTTVAILPENEGDSLALTAIDTTVEDYQNLLFGGKAGTISFTVNPEESGISAIGDRLSTIDAQGGEVSEVHIVSEGSAGNFWLGNDFVSHENIEAYRQQLQAWGVHLTPEADILLYSCLTGLGEVGDSLIHSLAAATGADVTASTNLTGNAALGGDWVLEKSTGNIEASLGFVPEVLENYAGKLAIFTATNGNDTGTGSLREAIADANGSTGADEIRFSGVTLVDLTSGELGITDELTITGGTTNVTVQRNAGAADFRIFNVTGGAMTTFDNLTITNGKVTDKGGGINSNGEVNLTNSTVSGNSSSDRGGGIYTQRAITLSDSLVSGNSSNQYGGGMATRSQITVTNSTVSGNSSRRNGAGLYSRSGNISLTDSTVSDNSSNRHGGGVWARSRTITLTNSTVSGNSSRLSAAGMYSQTANIIDSVVSDNTSGDLGGGVYATGTTTITNSTISGNSSANKGGGVYFRNNLTVTDSTLSNNSSNRGGGIYSRGGGTVNITNTTISGNSSSDRGGGIFARGNGGGTISIFNSTIANNTSGNNGGGILRNGGTVNLTNTIVATNIANGSGNDLSGTFNAVENSLIGDTAGATITTSTNNLTDIDPGLLALGDYGGATQTHALRPDSPALNAGDNALTTVSTDQRGVDRIFDGTVDIGAYESHGFSLLSNNSTLTLDRSADSFAPIDASVQVVENAFSIALPLDGLSVDYSLDRAGVLGAFSNGTTVVTNSQGIAVNFFNLTGFEESFSGSFQISANLANLAAFGQQVEGSITINTFDSFVSNNTVNTVESRSSNNISHSLDLSNIAGLIESWERRSLSSSCSAVPNVHLGEKEASDRTDAPQLNENCFFNIE
ncbi:MAG: DUF4347 domain-containing protein [Cyanobacteria bacterium P01_E01_bin.42]